MLARETSVEETDAAALLRRLLIAAVALSAITLFVAAVAIAWLVRGGQNTTAWVNHTYRVEHVLSDIRVDLEKTEAARRGYLISGDPRYQAIFQTTKAHMEPRIDEIAQLTRDNPRQAVAVVRLRAEVEAHLAQERSSFVSGREAVKPGAAAAAILADQAQLQQTRAVLSGMAAEEARLLDLRTDAQTRLGDMLLAVALLAAGVIVLLALGAYLLMRRYAGDLDRSRAALRRLNTGLEDEVARRTAELTRANAEIQRFAYIVSHDLRSPLVNVMGFTSEMEMTLKPLRALIARAEQDPAGLGAGREVGEARVAIEQEIPEAIGFIRASTQKMDRLINAILKLSREGRRTLTPEPVAMAALMDQIAGSLKRQTEERGAEIEIDPALPDLIGDRVATEQVFSNVIENALKYLKPGRPGRIVVRGRREGELLVYEVQDNGRGIAPRDHDRVFDLFRRAGVQDQPGEGIGLAHVRALIHRLGGHIAVQSELDQGATFRICLPPVLKRSEDTPA